MILSTEFNEFSTIQCVLSFDFDILVTIKAGSRCHQLLNQLLLTQAGKPSAVVVLTEADCDTKLLCHCATGLDTTHRTEAARLRGQVRGFQNVETSNSPQPRYKEGTAMVGSAHCCLVFEPGPLASGTAFIGREDTKRSRG